MSQTDTNEILDFANRYVAIWHEPDGEQRRQGVAALWEEDGRYTNEVSERRGYQAIEAAVTRVYEEFVEKGYVFRYSRVVGHHGTIRLYWEMLPASGGKVEAIGFDFFFLGEDGRIRYDYQYNDQLP